MNIVCHKFACG